MRKFSSSSLFSSQCQNSTCPCYASRTHLCLLQPRLVCQARHLITALDINWNLITVFFVSIVFEHREPSSTELYRRDCIPITIERVLEQSLIAVHLATIVVLKLFVIFVLLCQYKRTVSSYMLYKHI